MKRIACLIVFWFTGFASHAKILNVVVKVPTDTPRSEVIFLTGDRPELCQWQPNCIVMAPRFPYTYEATVFLPDSVDSVQLKVTRGAWQKQAANWEGVASDNVAVQTNGEFTQLVTSVVNWTDFPRQGVMGDLRILRDVHSEQLGNKRDVQIWLPPGYSSDSGQRYPVIYMHDGQNLFDPATANYGADWRVDEVMTDLYQRKLLDTPAIIVGLSSSAERFAEYDYTLRGSRYADFVIHTIKPYIDRNFRTRPEREFTYTMGSSMGAYISLSLLWKHPEVFSKAGALSLPVAIQNWAIYRVFQTGSKPQLPIQIYMDHGTAGLDSSYLRPAQDFYKHLLQLGTAAADVKYLVFDYADHHEADWARRVSVPLKSLINSPLVRPKQCESELVLSAAH